jgi:hypothetical protein
MPPGHPGFGLCRHQRLHYGEQGDAAMTSFFRLQVDLDDLTDAMYDFVTDPDPSRNERPVILELNDINHDLVDVLECMVLDGTDDRQDVADFVEVVFGVQSIGPRKVES